MEQASCLPVDRVFNGLSSSLYIPLGETGDFAITLLLAPPWLAVSSIAESTKFRASIKLLEDVVSWAWFKARNLPARPLDVL